MSKFNIPLIRPTLPPIKEVLPSFRNIYASGQLTNGQFVKQFEKKAAKFLGVKQTVAVACGTDAILISLLLLNKKGKVISPSFTFSSPVHSLTLFGFEPVLADMDPKTYNIDIDDVEKKITKDTVALLIPHVFGNPCDIDRLVTLAKKHSLKIIFDGAHAFGSTYKNKSVAHYGDFTIFSFTPTKVLSIGEGGLIALDDDELATIARNLRNNGDTFDRQNERIGISSRLTEWQAAIGMAGIPYVKKNIARRIKLALLYKELLRDVKGIHFQKINNDGSSVYQTFSLVLDDTFPLKRDEMLEYLKENGIESKAYFYPPIHKKVPYKKLVNASLEDTDYISQRIFCLPLYSHMKAKEVQYVADIIKKIGGKK
jgi:dTDP-4-amino-4,6-dideoxygalactose transaminase